MNNDLMFSSSSGEHRTPRDLFDQLNNEFHFTLDAFATDQNALLPHYHTKDSKPDGLAANWAGERVFMNPPYGNPENVCRRPCTKKRCLDRGYHIDHYQPGLGDFLWKGVYEASWNNILVVALLPARTDTQWFSLIYDHEIYQFRNFVKEARFLKGRLKFGDAENSAPFPSMIIVMKGGSL